jgi:hypothetical protein
VLASFNNAAVFDQETGLVWEQSPDTTQQRWEVAQFNCTATKVGNRRGWRLPTIQELASLVDPTVPGFPDVSLPPGHPFSNVQSANYWSATSTSWVQDVTEAWLVTFSGGYVFPLRKGQARFVWCVRGGQGVDPQ